MNISEWYGEVMSHLWSYESVLRKYFSVQLFISWKNKTIEKPYRDDSLFKAHL